MSPEKTHCLIETITCIRGPLYIDTLRRVETKNKA